MQEDRHGMMHGEREGDKGKTYPLCPMYFLSIFAMPDVLNAYYWHPSAKGINQLIRRHFLQHMFEI